MEPQKHILIVTFPIDDHFIPTLEFARRTSEFHDVTFAMSKAKLGPLLRQNNHFQTTYGDILFVSIDDGLTTKELNGNGIVNQRLDVSTEQFLKSAFQKNRQLDGSSSSRPNKTSSVPSNGIEKLTKPVDVLILNILLGGSAVICHRYGVPYYLFNPFSSTLKLKLLQFDQQGLNAGDFKSNSVIYLNRVLEDDKQFVSKMSFAEGIIINSMRELEMPTLYRIPLGAPRMATMRMVCVGPLLPTEDLDSPSSPDLLNWLNAQDTNQVTFVSLGSTSELKAENIFEMGKALLQLEKPFVWSLSLRHQQYLPDEVKKVMAGRKDTAKETTRKFMIVTSVSKKLVLDHTATALFVSNCDWTSAMQCLAAGKPLVAWPMSSSQEENARFLTGLGTCRAIDGIENSAAVKVTAEVIARSIATVLDMTGTSFSGIRPMAQAAWLWKAKIDQTLRPGGTSHREFTRLMSRL